MNDFRADAQTSHVIHETPKRFWRIFLKMKKKSRFYFDALYWGHCIEPVCLLSRGLCTGHRRVTEEEGIKRVKICVSSNMNDPFYSLVMLMLNTSELWRESRVVSLQFLSKRRQVTMRSSSFQVLHTPCLPDVIYECFQPKRKFVDFFLMWSVLCGLPLFLTI